MDQERLKKLDRAAEHAEKVISDHSERMMKHWRSSKESLELFLMEAIHDFYNRIKDQRKSSEPRG